MYMCIYKYHPQIIPFLISKFIFISSHLIECLISLGI